jgi:hypothetical protein
MVADLRNNNAFPARNKTIRIITLTEIADSRAKKSCATNPKESCLQG